MKSDFENSQDLSWLTNKQLDGSIKTLEAIKLTRGLLVGEARALFNLTAEANKRELADLQQRAGSLSASERARLSELHRVVDFNLRKR